MSKQTQRAVSMLIVGMLHTVFIASLSAQDMDRLKEAIFGGTDKLLIQAQSEQASILSPTNYRNGMDKYREALRDFKDGKPLKNLEKKLAQVRK